MVVTIRKADRRGRVLLPAEFANQTIVIEQISPNELRLRKKPPLSSLLARITPENLHPEADTGPAVGNEKL